MRWILTFVDLVPDKMESLEKKLSEGWEPFAITREKKMKFLCSYEVNRVWLRMKGN